MKKLEFFEQCDRWRVNNPEANALWHKMMDKKEPISRSTFKKAADLSAILDEGETLEEFMSGDEENYFRSSFEGITVVFAQSMGFEFIFTEDGQKPEDLIVNEINRTPSEQTLTQ